MSDLLGLGVVGVCGYLCVLLMIGDNIVNVQIVGFVWCIVVFIEQVGFNSLIFYCNQVMVNGVLVLGVICVVDFWLIEDLCVVVSDVGWLGVWFSGFFVVEIVFDDGGVGVGKVMIVMFNWVDEFVADFFSVMWCSVFFQLVDDVVMIFCWMVDGLIWVVDSVLGSVGMIVL